MAACNLLVPAFRRFSLFVSICCSDPLQLFWGFFFGVWVAFYSWYRRKQAELELRRKCCWQVFTDIEYDSEQEQLGLNNFFSDLSTLKDALQDRKQKSMKRKKSSQVVDEDAIKISSLYSTDAGSHAISPETEDKLFNRPNPPTNLTVAVRSFPPPGMLCSPGGASFWCVLCRRIPNHLLSFH